MALNGCSSGLVVTAVVALLLLPAQYYVPDLYLGVEDPLLEQSESAPSAVGWFDFAFVQLPPLDLFVTVTFLILAMSVYLCEWVQIKLMERRIVKVRIVFSYIIKHISVHIEKTNFKYRRIF